MKAKFTVHVSIEERNVVLTCDTEEVKGLDTPLYINVLKQLENTRGRIKQQIDRYYTEGPSQETDDTGDGQEPKTDAPEAQKSE